MSYRPTKNFSLLNRSSIIADYPWVNQHNQKMVVGTDLDATISSVLAHHVMGWEIVGFYNLETIYRKKGVTKEEFYGAIWLDLDISLPNIKSIGHHILRIDGKPLEGRQQQTLNPNLLQGVTYQYYTQKYPLATLHFLLWLWDVNPSVANSLALPLYWLPDSTFINGQSGHYEKNVKHWLECLPIQALTDTVSDIDTLAFEQSIKKLFQEFEKRGWPQGTGKNRSNHLKLSGGQCKFSQPNPPYLNNLYRFISNVTGWDAPVCPIEFVSATGVYKETSIEQIYPLNNLALTKFLDNYDVFSYAITEYEFLKYTSKPFKIKTL